MRIIKHKDELILTTAWAVLYVPYIIFGGLVRDDLKRLTSPLEFTNYLSFQWHISSHINMTARPVSAVLHGLCYWYFGTTAWLFHLVNLVLFWGSVLFFYLFLKELLSRKIAILSSLFALIYPCASGTLFSSIMMNSNLAAFFWSSALYTATKNIKGKNILVTGLLLLSSLSYEAFIPLFTTNIILPILILKHDKAKNQQFLIETLPAIIAIALYGIYRGYIEKVIFNTNFSRIVITFPSMLIYRFIASLILGIQVAIIDSIKISILALKNLELVSSYYLVIVVIGIVLIGIYLYKSVTSENSHEASNSSYVRRFAKQKNDFQIENFSYLDLSMMAIFLFFCAHLIYAFSNYLPDSSGFENRTLGGIRFITALSISIFALTAHSISKSKPLRKFVDLSIIGVLALFTLSIIGQQEAWITAAHYNSYTLSKINDAIREQHLDNLKALTLVAILPSEFPGQINNEPIFGTPWDITPSLSLTNPTMTINANVYNPKNTIATSDKVAINVLGNHWETPYPFWLYKFEDNKIYQVTSEQDWHNLISKKIDVNIHNYDTRQ